jgi:gas vesicle protein
MSMYVYDEETDMDMDRYRHVKLIGSGLLVGALAGAVVMLFVAPQSGKKMRAALQKKTAKLRDSAMETMEDTLERTRDGAKKLTDRVQDRAGDLQKRGRGMLPGRKDRMHQMMDRGKKVLAR